MVPRGRIGLPTQRFSVSCSTTELPWHMVGVDGLEPSTSPLSEVRSNQLSYTPPTTYKKNFLQKPLYKFRLQNQDLFKKNTLYLTTSCFLTTFQYTKPIYLIFIKNGYSFVHSMNNLVYNSHNWLNFAMTSMTTISVHIHFIGPVFYG